MYVADTHVLMALAMHVMVGGIQGVVSAEVDGVLRGSISTSSIFCVSTPSIC